MLDLPLEGGCQCGAARYRIDGQPLATAVCHCTDCQRQSGSAFGMSLIVSRSDFTWLSGETAQTTKTADSGALTHCFFCPTCGTRLYNQREPTPEVVNLKPGTLDHTLDLVPTLHVWTSSKQPWVEIPEGTRSFEKNP